MGIINHFTRGGQIAMHRLRMFSQISYTTFIISMLVVILFVAFSAFKNITPYQWYLYKEYLYADFMLSVTFDNKQKVLQDFQSQDGKTKKVRALDVVNSHYLQHNKSYVESELKRIGLNAIWIFVIGAIAAIAFFIFRGRQQYRKKLDRGNKLVSVKELSRSIIKEKSASDLNIDGLPLIARKETSHILVTGTTGAGKSNLFNTLLPQIKQRSERAIIVDFTGDYVARYYDSDTDIILNPFDQRSPSWSIWQECKIEAQFDAFAEALIPSKKIAQETFWEDASRIILATALKKYHKERNYSIKSLYNLLIEKDLRSYHQYFEGTDAATFTDIKGEKTTTSIRSTLASHITFLKYLDPQGGSFSIRDWVEHSKEGWLFLTARADQRASLRPFMSALLDTAFNAAMTLNPDPERRLLFGMDELPVLQQLPSLPTALSEGRKYGTFILAGMQNLSQLRTLYGQSAAQSLLDLFNTKVFFRSTDPDTTEWISKVLGESEIEETKENLSYGANSIRDGVSLGQVTKTKPIVLPTEIANLEDLQCYVKLPGNWPVTKLQMSYKPMTRNAPAFLLKPEKAQQETEQEEQTKPKLAKIEEILPAAQDDVDSVDLPDEKR